MANFSLRWGAKSPGSPTARAERVLSLNSEKIAGAIQPVVAVARDWTGILPGSWAAKGALILLLILRSPFNFITTKISILLWIWTSLRASFISRLKSFLQHVNASSTHQHLGVVPG
jgi:hypothetical protein